MRRRLPASVLRSVVAASIARFLISWVSRVELTSDAISMRVISCLSLLSDISSPEEGMLADGRPKAFYEAFNLSLG